MCLLFYGSSLRLRIHSVLVKQYSSGTVSTWARLTNYSLLNVRIHFSQHYEEWSLKWFQVHLFPFADAQLSGAASVCSELMLNKKVEMKDRGQCGIKSLFRPPPTVGRMRAWEREMETPKIYEHRESFQQDWWMHIWLIKKSSLYMLQYIGFCTKWSH